MTLSYFSEHVMSELEFTDYIVKVRYKDHKDDQWTVLNEILTTEGAHWCWEYDWMDATYEAEVIGWIRVEDVEVPKIGGIRMSNRKLVKQMLKEMNRSDMSFEGCVTCLLSSISCSLAVIADSLQKEGADDGDGKTE